MSPPIIDPRSGDTVSREYLGVQWLGWVVEDLSIMTRWGNKDSASLVAFLKREWLHVPEDLTTVKLDEYIESMLEDGHSAFLIYYSMDTPDEEICRRIAEIRRDIEQHTQRCVTGYMPRFNS